MFPRVVFLSFAILPTQTASAFAKSVSVPSHFPRRFEVNVKNAQTRSHAGSSYDMEMFERALECAEKFGFCEIKQMDQLAEDLEKVNGAYFETANEPHAASMMMKEVNDRKDVAEILRLQSELRRRMEHLKGANLFAKDVHEMEDAYPELS
jgi:hypothetical protein